jgi:HlyD family secretion protein
MRSLGRKTAAAIAAAMAAAACQQRPVPDAYGNVEATEVVVGAEASGRLVSYVVADGQKLAAGATVGAVDATEAGLDRDQVAAQREATASRIAEIARQIDVLEAQRGVLTAQRDAAKAQRDALSAQHDIAKRAYDRTNRLFAAQAATAQQLDQAERDFRVLSEQIRAQDEQITAQDRQVAAQTDQVKAARAQQQTVRQQTASVQAQVNQAAERLKKTQLVNPIAGTVLTSYAKTGEFVQRGQPLYKIANLDAVEVRAYITELQLAHVRIGQTVQVTIDTGRGQRQTLPGTIAWISSEAEFTPTPVQTREERADLVYAIKITVRNEAGALKIGMPADVQFAPTGGAP